MSSYSGIYFDIQEKQTYTFSIEVNKTLENKTKHTCPLSGSNAIN